MKIDFYTKTILTVIAICLMTLILRTVPLVPTAIAQGSFECRGSLEEDSFSRLPDGARYVDVWYVIIRCN